MAEPAASPSLERLSGEHLIAAYQSQRNQALNAQAVAESRVATLKAELAAANKRIADLEAQSNEKDKPAASTSPKAKPRAAVKRTK